VQEQQVG
jgi:hypothetical protein